MYQALFNAFENVTNLGGKTWEHAVAIFLINSTNIKDCSIHGFHYQQMFECFFSTRFGDNKPVWCLFQIT